ncbi:10997_t:CDS:2, partial [Cetraspora pellucida]
AKEPKKVKIDLYTLEIEHTLPLFKVDHTTIMLEVEKVLSNLKVGITSPTLETKKTSSTLEVNITFSSLTDVKFALSISVSELNTVNDAFIEDVNDESQATLKSLLNEVEILNLYTKTLLFSEAIFTLQSLQQFQKLEHNEAIHHATPLRNQFEIAFSVSKTAINIVLKTNSDEECNSNNSYDNTNKNDIKNELDKVVPLQQQLISQITDSKVVKICGASFKKRIKSFVEVSDRRVNDQIINNSETSSQA